MANSRYEYVRSFERSDSLLQSTFIVVRIDGRGFHRVSSKYGFEKPNDRRALELMNACAMAVMKELPDIVVAYGVSDEFSFIFKRDSSLFDRRESKLTTTVVSTFTAYYISLWSKHFFDASLSPPFPTFDGRAILYPSIQILRDYISWRQVDCHINNLYNTVFWALVARGGMPHSDAEDALKGTVAADKNEILYSRFSMNYNNEPDMFKKGSVVYRSYGNDGAASSSGDTNKIVISTKDTTSKTQREKERKRHEKATIMVEHVDIIKDDFWEARPWLLPQGPE